MNRGWTQIPPTNDKAGPSANDIIPAYRVPIFHPMNMGYGSEGVRPCYECRYLRIKARSWYDFCSNQSLWPKFIYRSTRGVATPPPWLYINYVNVKVMWQPVNLQVKEDSCHRVLNFFLLIWKKLIGDKLRTPPLRLLTDSKGLNFLKYPWETVECSRRETDRTL